MKKRLLLLLCMLLCIVFVACDKGGETTAPDEPTTDEPTTDVPPEESTTPEETTTDEPTTDEPSTGDLPDPDTPPVVDYTFIERDGIHYMVFDDYSKYKVRGDRELGVGFDSLEEFRESVLNKQLSEDDIAMFSVFNIFKYDGNWMECVDFDDLRYPVFPNNLKMTREGPIWYGNFYMYPMERIDQSGYFMELEIMPQEAYKRFYQNHYVNFANDGTDVNTYPLEYRNGILTEYRQQEYNRKYKYSVVQYNIEVGGIVFMIKAVSRSIMLDPAPTMPSDYKSIDILWNDGEHYYHIFMPDSQYEITDLTDITEEWLAQWGSISYEQYMAEKEADDDVTDIVGPPDHFSLGSMEDLRSLLEASVSQMSDEEFAEYFDALCPYSLMARYQVQRLSGYLENTWLPYLKPEVRADAFSVEFTAGASGEAEIKRDYMNVNYQIDGVQYQFSCSPHMSISTPEGEPLYGNVSLGSTAVDLYLHERGDRLVGYYTAGDIVVRLTIWDYDDATAFDRILQMFEPTPWNAS